MKLTAKQEAFARLIVSGVGPSDAYRQAGYAAGSPKRVSIKAAGVGRHPLVVECIAKLKAKVDRKTILTRQDKLERLAAMVRVQVGEEEQLTSDQLKAIEIDARMQGHNEPEKIKVEGLGSIMQEIRKAARKP